MRKGEPPTHEITPDEISALVCSIDPVDWQQMELLARLSPADRILTGLSVAEFAKAALRGTLSQRFPDWSLSQLNMVVLRHFTTVRMGDDERS
jgi:hypothetical protein